MLDIRISKNKNSNNMPDKPKKGWMEIYKFTVEVTFDVLKYYLKIAAYVIYILILFVQSFLPPKYHIKPTEQRPQHNSKVKQGYDTHAAKYESRDPRQHQTPKVQQEIIDTFNPKYDYTTDDFSESILKNDKQFVNLQLTQAVPQEGIVVNFQVAKDGKLPPIRKMEMVPIDNHHRIKTKYGDEESIRSHHSMKRLAGSSKDAIPAYQNVNSNHMTDEWNQNVREMLKKKTNTYQAGPPQVEADEHR